MFHNIETIPRTNLADFGDKVRPFPSHLQLSRWPKSATLFCRGRQYRPSFTLKSVAVAEVGDSLLSRSPIPAAPHFEICRGRRSRRHIFVAVTNTGRPSFRNLSRSPKTATLGCRGSPVICRGRRSPKSATLCRGSRFAEYFVTGPDANVTVFVVEKPESFLSLSPTSVNYITHK